MSWESLRIKISIQIIPKTVYIKIELFFVLAYTVQ